MEDKLLFLTSADTVGGQAGVCSLDGEVGIESKASAANKIISGVVDVDSLKNTIRILTDALNSEVSNEGALVVDELVISLGINGSGEVGILAVDTKMAAEASIKVTLKRNKGN